MTREEVIKWFKTSLFMHKDHEPFQMAIKALEQESCEDTISRQAVLSYIYNDLGLGDEENGADVERQMELEKSYEYVKSLPPVTSQPEMGRWIRSDKDKLRCSACGVIHLIAQYPSGNIDWCPNCGTKMQEIKKNGLSNQD